MSKAMENFAEKRGYERKSLPSKAASWQRKEKTLADQRIDEPSWGNPTCANKKGTGKRDRGSLKGNFEELGGVGGGSKGGLHTIALLRTVGWAKDRAQRVAANANGHLERSFVRRSQV